MGADFSRDLNSGRYNHKGGRATAWHDEALAYTGALISARHAGLDPASSFASDLIRTGLPFDCAQGGEPVEPRVKPGMTKRLIWVVWLTSAQLPGHK